jgi:dipeptide/tripeptide permease
MSTLLHWATVIAGGMTIFIGAWGQAIAGSMSTPELQEMQFWITLALIIAGVGLVASGVARLRTPLDH